MKARGAAFQGALALVGLVAAYLTWQRPPESTKGEVTLWSLSKKSVSKVRFQDGAAFLEVFREDGALWVRQGQDAVPPPASSDGGVAVPPAPPKPPRTVRANERAEKLLEKFAPFRAPRGFGVLDAAKVKELGIEGATRKLEVFAEGTQRTFVVAPGNASPFAKDEKDGQVYLLASSLLNELTPTSQQLVERRLHAFRNTDFDGFSVKAAGASKEFVYKAAQLQQPEVVSARASPDKPDDYVRNWHDRVWNKLLVGEVLGRGEAVPGGEPRPTVRIEYFLRGQSVGFLELAPASETESKASWARTEHTANWVSIPQGGPEVLGEAGKVVGN